MPASRARVNRATWNPLPGRGGDGQVVAGLLLALAGALAVALLGLADASAALGFGALFPGLVALGSGALLALRGSREAGPARWRQWLGAALIVWGVGQLVNGVAIVAGSPVFPTPGDLISLLAVPLGIWGALAQPARGPATPSRLRLSLDSVLLGVTVAIPCWHFGYAGLFAAGDRPAGLPTAVVLVADLAVACVAVLRLVAGLNLRNLDPRRLDLRDLDASLVLVCLGVVGYVIGDLIALHSTLLHPGMRPWQVTILWCAGWPLIAAGLLSYQPVPVVPDAESPADPDARGVLITSLVGCGLLLLALSGLLFGSAGDRVSIGLLIIAVAVLASRELLNSRGRADLLTRLYHEATADPLTGLANRRALAARMATLPPGEPWCLLTVDLDGFKDVNDLLGHATGDLLLAAVAHRLKAASPPESLVSRMGGDEFAVLLPGEIEVGARVGGQIITAVRKSAADVEGVGRVEVSASIGVAAMHVGAPDSPAPADPDRIIDLTDARLALDPAGTSLRVPVEPGPDRLNGHAPLPPPLMMVDPLGALSASGAALRMAKAGGRNRVEVYDAAVAQVRQRRLRVEERLRSAVESGAITVLFQPIMDLRRGVVGGAEALARWTDPELGRVDPGEFITVAEQTGMVVAIGEHILEQSLSNAVKDGLFDRGLRINCNVSPVQLRVAGFHQVVAEAMAHHGVAREQLVIEVTEQVLVEEGQAAQTLHRLAGLGLTIAIDDFGTGYSALGYLQRLPADILKIDRSLTSSLVAEPRSRAITRAVLDLGRTVGVSVVVEGVETSQVADLVRRMGVGFGQGLYYGDAMPGPELAAMIDRLKAAAARA